MPRALASTFVALGNAVVVRPLRWLAKGCMRGCAWWWDVDGAIVADDADGSDDKDFLLELGSDRSDSDAGADRVSYLDLHRDYARGGGSVPVDDFFADVSDDDEMHGGGGKGEVDRLSADCGDAGSSRPEVLTRDEEPGTVEYSSGVAGTVYHI